MDREQMITFIKQNPYVHVAHRLFCPGEYIYSKEDGNIYDENDYLFENWNGINSRFNGLATRVGGSWDNGWYITE